MNYKSLTVYTVNALLYVTVYVTVDAVWTEDDESQRIAMIINNDKKAFEEEMRSQRLSRPSSAQLHSELPREVHSPVPSSASRSVGEENWCYHCVTPMKHITHEMKKTVKQFLHLRRAAYHHEVATEHCNNAKNFSLLQKQTCRHQHCATISLLDHDQGVAFVMRGCAENFGAVDSKYLEAQGHNSCTKLHDHLDMEECLCSTRRYCYAGHKRRRSSSHARLSFLFSVLLIDLYLRLL
ncbi:hypothetical protein Q1695_001627 [Nippostrongylus brasiliensis]|nr:hypothetical protein Q1695_001627 [Nippostrongylus brasiliensis]